MLTATSMLDEPSSGSMRTTYRCESPCPTITPSAISSEPTAATAPDWDRTSTKMSELCSSRIWTTSPLHVDVAGRAEYIRYGRRLDLLLDEPRSVCDGGN